MFEFLDIIEREIPTFTGIYFDHDVESDEMILLKSYKPKKFFIADTKLSLISPLFEGFDVLSITFTNLYPDIVYKLYDGLKNKRCEYQFIEKILAFLNVIVTIFASFLGCACR